MKSYRDHPDDYSRLNYHRGADRERRYADSRSGAARNAAYGYMLSKSAKNSASGIKTVIPARSAAVRAVCALLAAALLFTGAAAVTRGIMLMSFPRKYQRIVSENCRRFGVDESFVYAVIRTESGFDPEARSSVGALGLMQIMPDTFRWLRAKMPAEGEDGVYEGIYAGYTEYTDEQMLLDPEINIRYGVFLLSVLRSEFGSDTLAAAAYHAGMGRVREWVRSGALAEGSRCEDIPSGVTSHYVYKVERARRVYYDLYYK